MIGSFDLGSTRLHDETGTRSAVRFVGLTGLPAVRGEAPNRPEDDGAIEPDLAPMSARIVTGNFETWAASIAAAQTDWDTIGAQLEAASAAPVLCAWTRPGGTRPVQGYGRVIGDVLPEIDAADIGAFIRYQVQLRFADPRWYSTTLDAQSVGAPTFDGGFPLPIVFPLVFGSGSSGGSMDVTNSGKSRTWPTLTVTGPIVNPVVENVTVGRLLAFTGLTLAAGQQLIIETAPRAPRSVTVDGANVLGALDLTVSAWWWLEPGVNTVRFYGASGYGVGTTLAEAHRPAWIT